MPEIRSFDKEKRATAVGWFDDQDRMAKWVAKTARDGIHEGHRSVHDAVYWTINPVSAALLSRKQKNEMSLCSTASRDEDVTRRIWLPIDIDPVRPSGISASAAERGFAREVANAVLDELLITASRRTWFFSRRAAMVFTFSSASICLTIPRAPTWSAGS